MAARKLAQEIDKCFKKVGEGVTEFENIYVKIEQSTNAAQKEKLEDNLKREIKKLQRLRDQIKTWAASNDIKDKAPLLEHRKLIETQMEKFKAVEKAMKTKAYSKEGLSAAAKLDPKERAKAEACDFLSNMVEELERQIEQLEAESESIQATMKKGKGQSSKADRIAEIERLTDRHKWHQGKLELIKRSLENGGVETEQVNDLEENIKYYVTDGMNDDFMEDEEMYDELNLQDEEDAYGMNLDNDRTDSQDTQSIQDDGPDHDRSNSIPGGKKPSSTEPSGAAARRSSVQLKSPLPTLATLHTPLSNIPNASTSNMKPATLPARAPGETLKYASAAAAAAASNNVGIAPLPPPPGATNSSSVPAGFSPLPPPSTFKTGASASPTPAHSQPTSAGQTPAPKPSVPAPSAPSEPAPAPAPSKSPALSQTSTNVAQPSQATSNDKPDPAPSRVPSSKTPSTPAEPPESSHAAAPHTNGVTNGVKENNAEDSAESVFHLPASLQDLVKSFEITQARMATTTATAPSTQRMLAASSVNSPNVAIDAEQPRYYKPAIPYATPSYYPKDPLPIFDNPALYSRIDPDTMFYIFYYKQGSYYQYLAAKALKDQSWRFHKQYQTWFQRHEEPKTITEEYEQGTYRFFDYESTWMNRRKADFKFAYKFLEDDV